METLHTLLLGPYKYLLRRLIPQLSSTQKQEIEAILSAFNFSGIANKLDVKLLKHYKSFVGRNFKSLAQCGVFVFRNYFSSAEKDVWTALSKVRMCHRLDIISWVLDFRYSKSPIVTTVLSQRRPSTREHARSLWTL